MFGSIVRFYRRIKEAAVRRLALLACRAVQLVRRVWVAHVARLAGSATYTAGMAILFAAILGVSTLGEAATALLSLILGVYVAGYGSRTPVRSLWTQMGWERP